MIKLSNATLSDLPKDVLRPDYDRAALKPGIVHIGLGNFHRAHQSWYLHRLMQQGLDHDWSIIGAGVRPYDIKQRAKLLEQDCLTTLIELSPARISAEVIGSMTEYVPIQEGNGPLIAQLASPSIRIVSLTVTEGGYYLDQSQGYFDEHHPDILHDAQHPQRPVTVFGSLIAAIRKRRAQNIGPFTIQSCDNLQDNGKILRQSIISLARMSDPGLADWIDKHYSFPSSMVDCIVPATGSREISQAQSLGIDDAVPVTHENFRQWVIEDDFCAGRPAWEQIGVTFSNNIHGYETQKLRILNAGHQVIANVSEVMGITTVSQAMSHPSIRAMFRKITLEEIVPHVTPVPGMTPEQYLDLIEQRFSNPTIRDTIRRIAFDGSSRHTGMVLPSIRDGLEKGIAVEGLALVEAAWARMCEGTRDDGSMSEPNDPFWNDLTARSKEARHKPILWLELNPFYGDLASEPRFTEPFERWLTSMYHHGMETTVNRYLAGQ